MYPKVAKKRKRGKKRGKKLLKMFDFAANWVKMF